MREYSPEVVRAGPTRPVVSILIVNYRSYDELGSCLRSLRQYEPEADVVVVDWASDADAVERLRTTHPEARWQAESGNRGFGAGVNLAARLTTAPWLLLLNPDATVEPGLTDTLIASASADPRVAVVGPRILDADGSIQASARRFPGASAVLGGRSTWLTRIWPGNPLSRFNLLATEMHDVRTVDWVSGACMLIRREAFDSVGGFDEGYFLYWEDADLCRRLETAGWRTVYDPGAQVHHSAARSSRHARARSLVAFHRSVFRYYWKHTGLLWHLGAPLVWLALQLRLGLALVTAARR